MPVSKKPPAKKTATKAPSKPRAAVPALPDRRAMEHFLAVLGDGRDRDDPTAKAQDVMYEAWEQTTTRSRIALARKALSISPLCADAYVLLAEEAAQTVGEARDYYAKGVKAGELALGPEGFAEYEGEFWGFLETRPYMRARAGLASALLKLGDVDGAIGHFRDMLRLNPNDNQGIRYLLAGCLLRRGDDNALKELLASYEDEGGVFWLYTQALLAFREGGENDERAAALAREAWAANEHVPAILAGTKPHVPSENGYITLGGPDEATDYVAECGQAWHRTPGAVAWLTKIVANLSSKQRARPAAHRSH
jgi:tetratricopeptide (TPR) repeat protein